MGDLRYFGMALLASETVNLQNGDPKSIVYTVPPGVIMIPMMVVIHTPTASLAGGIDYDIGSGALADTWKQNNDLSALINVTDYKVITDLQKHTMEVAGAEFGILPITGAVLNSDAIMDVFGYLVIV